MRISLVPSPVRPAYISNVAPSSQIMYPPPRKSRIRTSPDADLSDSNSQKRQRLEHPQNTVSVSALFAASRVGTESVWVSRFRPGHTSDRPALCIDSYRAALRESQTFLYAIDPRTFIAEIYDPITHKKGRGVDAWVVLQGEYNSLTGCTTFSCCKWCPDKARYQEPCLHELALNGRDRVHRKPVSVYDNPNAIAFRWTPSTEQEPALLMFCVMSSNFGPTVISFNGYYSNAGVWMCKRCRGVNSCMHIETAQGIGYHDRLLAQEDVTDSVAAERNRKQLEEHISSLREKANRNSLRDLHEERSVSFTSVNMPRWCSVGDGFKPPAAVPTHKLPRTFQLGVNARCRCGAPPLASRKPKFIPCIVYHTSHAVRHRIMVQPCSKCPPERHMFAGPDLGEFGLFNLNNSRLFSHTLLNDYTTAMTSMEAPFHAYTEVVRKRYIDCSSRIAFAGEDLFRTAWFSRSRLLRQLDSMRCDICGDHPECVIFDGQTGGFEADMRTSLLCPPTTLMPDSTQKNGANKPARETAAIIDAVGKRARLAVRWRKALTRSGQSRPEGLRIEDYVDDPADGDTQPERARLQMQRRLSKRDAADASMQASLSSIADELERHVCPALASMFRTVVSSPHDLKQEEVRQPYLEFLSQFMPESTFVSVHWLLADEPDAAAALLASVPALGVIARMEQQALGNYTAETKEIASWLMRRSATIQGPFWPDTGWMLVTLTNLNSAAKDSAAKEATDQKQTGSCWGRRRIRSRPIYPNLPGDNSTDRAVVTEEVKAAGIGCSKFYEAYGIQGQTGGIMAAWCPHLDQSYDRNFCFVATRLAPNHLRNTNLLHSHTRDPIMPGIFITSTRIARPGLLLQQHPRRARVLTSLVALSK
ncbi:hypothetical protein BKA62DRAFT_779474 [Auriculariales sp. MPI-PUGE-AT-0066]|nr:hypothetical protein BKA62DRAFT_779474 [Auriculariales sp. MPI-PUGE-AT-0066]